MSNFNFRDFVNEVYAKSTPSVDFSNTTDKIIPWNHKLNVDTYDEILDKHCGDDQELILNCQLWMLNSGPSLTNEQI